ncbi:MAG: hypothetical protein JXB06_00495 [Spirochaetales bacterium]|nr:hypothetical protein [Spirochaetales bacterium]
MPCERIVVVMADRRLTIVTGPIDSGKTRWCRRLAAGHPGCAGLLLAKIFRQGKRIGYDAVRLPLSETIPFARLAGNEPPGWRVGGRVGRFLFSAEGLQAGNSWLIEAAGGAGPIIVDEIGPLELEGGGLSAGLRAVLASELRLQLYIVIRSGFVEEVCARFGIGGYSLVEIAGGSGTHGPGTHGPGRNLNRS